MIQLLAANATGQNLSVHVGLSLLCMLVIPVTVPSAVSAYSVVGEREQGRNRDRARRPSTAAIDQSSGETLATITIPRAQAVTTGAGEVWILAAPRSRSATINDPVSGTAALSEVNPTDSQIVDVPITLSALEPNAIAAGDGIVWVADYARQTLTRFRVSPDPDQLTNVR